MCKRCLYRCQQRRVQMQMRHRMGRKELHRYRFLLLAILFSYSLQKPPLLALSQLIFVLNHHHINTFTVFYAIVRY
jgi:hypothetical protein